MRVASIALRTRRRQPASPQAMTVIALASSKGGVGKTTLTMNLAAGLSRWGRTVEVDADPQQSAGQWRWVVVGLVFGFCVVVVVCVLFVVFVVLGRGFCFVVVVCLFLFVVF